MRLRVFGAGPPVRPAPVPRIDADRAPALVGPGIDEERRRDFGRDALALLVYGVAVEATRTDARAAPTLLEVKRQEMCRLNRPHGAEAGADGFAPAREPREVMEADRAR